MLALKPILVFFAVVLGVVFVVCDYILRVDDNYTVTLRRWYRNIKSFSGNHNALEPTLDEFDQAIQRLHSISGYLFIAISFYLFYRRYGHLMPTLYP